MIRRAKNSMGQYERLLNFAASHYASGGTILFNHVIKCRNSLFLFFLLRL